MERRGTFSRLNCQSDWARVLSWAFVYFQFDVSVNISYFNHYETVGPLLLLLFS